MPPTGTSMFVEADVLMNVKADEYVAVFGVSREAETVEECGKKMDAAVKEFSEALKPLGVGDGDVFVDFVAQNQIYGFEVTGDIAREKLVGFELKKNVSIHYRDQALLDKLIVAAAKAKVYDLIKVDYVVKDSRRVHDRLMKEAARVIKHKTARYEELLGIKLQPPAQVYAEQDRDLLPHPDVRLLHGRRSPKRSAASTTARNTRSSPPARAGPSSSTPSTATDSTW